MFYCRKDAYLWSQKIKFIKCQMWSSVGGQKHLVFNYIKTKVAVKQCVHAVKYVCPTFWGPQGSLYYVKNCFFVTESVLNKQIMLLRTVYRYSLSIWTVTNLSTMGLSAGCIFVFYFGVRRMTPMWADTMPCVSAFLLAALISCFINQAEPWYV